MEITLPMLAINPDWKQFGVAAVYDSRKARQPLRVQHRPLMPRKLRHNGEILMCPHTQAWSMSPVTAKGVESCHN